MTTIPIVEFDVIQTFYADPNRVNNSGVVALTSVDLYFKSKPSLNGRTSTGRTKPGVIISICDTREDEPDISRIYGNSYSRLSYDDIAAFTDASAATSFPFSTPIELQTGQSYGIVVSFEDPGYELWENVSGDRLIGTNNPSPGSNLVKDGKLYSRTNAGVLTPRGDRDLKFAINCAKYTSNTVNEAFANPAYEFFTTTTESGRFLAGEWAYQTVANATGNVTFTAGTTRITSAAVGGADFTGSSPTVTAGDKLVLYSNSSFQQVVQVLNVINSTAIDVSSKIAHSNTTTNWMKPPIGRVYYVDKSKRKLYLSYSSANSSLSFSANNNAVYGEDSRASALISSIDNISVDRVKIAADASNPLRGNIDLKLAVAESNSTPGFDISLARQRALRLNEVYTRRWGHHDGFIVSRSNEINNAGLLSQTTSSPGESTVIVNRVSAVVNAAITVNESNTALYRSPQLPTSLDMFVMSTDISNTYTTTDANSVVIDSEVQGPYLARSKHITKKVSFANNRFAEDCRVFISAYRPADTDILVYAKIHNSADSDAFDDHAWSPLQYKENADKFSSSENENDFVEYELGFPQYPESANVLPCTVATTLSSNSVAVSGGGFGSTQNMSNYLVAGDMIKLYNPLIPEDYIIDVVSAATNTAITLENAIFNNNVVGNGFKVDRLKYYHTAFNNQTNDNVCRYYNTSKVEFDKFDSMQIKIVMLSDKTYITPRIDEIQVIGVSA